MDDDQGLGAWNTRRARLVEMFESTRAIARDLEDVAARGAEARHSTRLAEATETLRRATFRIMVFGDFSSGKSTLVNALLRHELLPMRENPTTAFTTVVGHAEEVRAELYHDLAAGSPALPVTVEQFRGLVELRLDEEGEPVESPYLWGALRGPYPLLRGHVELIDSAGTNESPEREQVTLMFLPHVDAIIFVTPARGAFKNRDRDHYLTMLQDLGHQEIFFVVNQFDLIRERDHDDVKRRCRTIAARYTRRPDRRLFFLSASEALEARTAEPPDEGRERESGVLELEGALEEFLVHDKARIKLLRPAELLDRQIVQLRGMINERRGMLAKSADQLRETLDSTRDRREHLQSSLRLIHDGLSSWAAETEQLLTAEVERFIRDLVPRVGEWARDMPRLKVRPFKGDRMERYAPAIKQIDEVLTRRLQRELHVFAASDAGPLATFMAEREERLERGVLPLLHDYAENLEELRGELTGSRGTVDERSVRQWLSDMSMHVPDRVLSRTSPVLSWPNAAGAAGMGTAGAAAGIGLAALGLVSWVAAPIVLSAGAILLLSGRLAKRRLADRATAEYAEALTLGAPNIAGRYAAECADGLRTWIGRLEKELDDQLGELISSAEKAIEDLQSDQSEVEDDRRALDRWDQSLNAIEVDLSDFKGHLLDEMR